MRFNLPAKSSCLLVALVALVFSARPALSAAAELPALKVSSDGRRLVEADGKAFFYLGDTAWELFHRLDRDAATHYLDDRAAKGFNVVQAVALAEFGGLTEPNPNGDLPLFEKDPSKPNDKYFEHVDWIISQANRRGMYVGLLPTWGDKFTKKWGQGPEIFTPDNAKAYGEYLGKRYKDRGVIWILGGDRNPETDQHKAIIRAMAEGLKKGDGGRNLMTYHPQGRSDSSQFFHDEKWLDFNMFQSGHGEKDNPSDRFTAADYARTPVKPVLDGEPRYEDHPVRNKAAKGQWFDDYDTRQAMYWSVLAGACGHTYGHHAIWQMNGTAAKPLTDARTPWRDALKHPGAAQVGFAKKLFESRPFLTLVPAGELATVQSSDAVAKPRAARDKDSSYALIYVATGEPVTVDLYKLTGEKIVAHWFDPRTGTMQHAGEFARAGKKTFTSPSHGRSNDWLLVLDDAAKKYPVWEQLPK